MQKLRQKRPLLSEGIGLSLNEVEDILADFQRSWAMQITPGVITRVCASVLIAIVSLMTSAALPRTTND